MLDLDIIFNSLKVNNYKKMSESRKVKLEPHIANTLGTDKYETTSYLSAVVDAISNKLFIEEVITDGTVEIKPTFDQRELFRSVVRDGEVFVLVTYDNIDTSAKYTIIPAFDGNRGAATIYNEYGETEYTINTWTVKPQKNNSALPTRYLDMYYPNRVEKYIHNGYEWSLRIEKDVNGNSDSGVIWLTDTNTSSGNALGIPLFKVSIDKSDLDNGAIQLQDNLNAAIIDMLAVSRTQGFPIRVLSGEKAVSMLTNSYGQPLVDGLGIAYRRTLELTPGALFDLSGTSTTLSQLEATTADTSVIDKLLHQLEIITTVPTHYFTGQWPSGVALIQSEQRLNSKCESHQDALEADIIDVMRYGYELERFYRDNISILQAQQESITKIVNLVYSTLETYTADLLMEQEASRVNNASTLVTAGILSVEDALRYIFPNKDETEIQNMAAKALNDRTLL